mgnify:CR=1
MTMLVKKALVDRMNIHLLLAPGPALLSPCQQLPAAASHAGVV